MISGTQCIIIILAVRFVQQYCSKRSSQLLPVTLFGNAKYFMITKLFASVFALGALLISWDFSSFDVLTVVISAVSGIMLVVSSVCSLYAIKSGTMALSSMFSTAGLIIPCIAGIFLYDEKMSLMQWLGVAVFFASSWLLIAASKKIYSGFSFKNLFLLIGSLVSNGITMMLQTVFKRTVPNGNVTMFSFLSFIVPALILLLSLEAFKIRKPSDCKEKLNSKLLIIAVISAGALFVVNQFATIAADKVEPVILFTFINGGNTIIAALIAAVFFKEKITVRSALGLALGIISLIIVKAF